MSQTATKTKPSPRDVIYDLEVVDELPAQRRAGGGGSHPSVLESSLTQLQNDKSKHGKWTIIGKYKVPTAATAAANTLRHRHGRKEVEGFEFATRKVTVLNTETNEEEDRNGLFAKFNPRDIKEGARAEWDQEEQKRLATLAERKAAKNKAEDQVKAEKAKGERAKQPQ